MYITHTMANGIEEVGSDSSASFEVDAFFLLQKNNHFTSELQFFFFKATRGWCLPSLQWQNEDIHSHSIHTMRGHKFPFFAAIFVPLVRWEHFCCKYVNFMVLIVIMKIFYFSLIKEKCISFSWAQKKIQELSFTFDAPESNRLKTLFHYISFHIFFSRKILAEYLCIIPIYLLEIPFILMLNW